MSYFRKFPINFNRYHLSIIVSVLLFNLIGVVGFKGLWHDDSYMYYLATNDPVPWWEVKMRLLYPLVQFFLAKIMIQVSPVVPRAFHLVFFMIPLSLCFYYLYRRIFGMHRELACAAAILPHVLPNQIGIPTGINEAYILWGFLPMMLGLFCGIEFVLSEEKGWGWLGASIILFCLGNAFASQALFMGPPLGGLILLLMKNNKKRCSTLFVCLCFIISSFFAYSRLFPRQFEDPIPLSLSTVVHRFRIFLPQSLPLPLENDYSYYGSLIILFLAMSSIFFPKKSALIRPGHFAWIPERFYPAVFFAFVSLWPLSTMGPFLAISPEFRVYDYSYIPNFSMVVFPLMAMQLLFGEGGIRKKTLTVVLVLLVLTVGFYKQYHLSKVYSPHNSATLALSDNLKHLDFPRNSQIVVFSAVVSQAGRMKPNTGYLYYTLGRTDITGLIGDEYPWLDPFREWGWTKRMVGLNSDQPLFLFRKVGDNLQQLRYFLKVSHVKDEYWERRLSWKIYSLHPQTGASTLIVEGVGMGSYREYLQRENKESNDIAWGSLDFNVFPLNTTAVAEREKEPGNLVDDPIQFGERYRIDSCFAGRADDGSAVWIDCVIKISQNKLPPQVPAVKRTPQLSTEYSLHEGNTILFKKLARWDMIQYLQNGDTILHRLTLPTTEIEKADALHFHLIDFGTWPWTEMSAVQQSGTNVTDGEMTISVAKIRSNLKD